MILTGPHPAAAEPDLESQITTASERLEALAEARNALAADLLATRAHAAAAQARLVELTTAVTQAQTRIGQVAAWAYRSGPASELTAVLAADSPGDFLGRLATLEKVGRAEYGQLTGLTALLDGVRAEQTRLTLLRTTQEAQEAEMIALTLQLQQDLDRLVALRATRAATRAAPASAPPAATPPPAVSGAAGEAVRFAYAQQGKPYRYAASGPDAYDCSGLTMAAWAAAGVMLPHNAARQFDSVRRVSRSDLSPGDLVFYYADIHHVALYVGDGQVIHAPNSGETVRVQGMDFAPIAGYGRP